MLVCSDMVGGVGAQIFCPAYVAVASAFPQCSAPQEALLEAAAAVGDVCSKAGDPTPPASQLTHCKENPSSEIEM